MGLTNRRPNDSHGQVLHFIVDKRLCQLFREGVRIRMSSNNILRGWIIAGQWQFIARCSLDQFQWSVTRHVDFFLDQPTIIAVTKGCAQVNISGEFTQRFGEVQGSLGAHNIDLNGRLKGSVEFYGCRTVENDLYIFTNLLQCVVFESEIFSAQFSDYRYDLGLGFVGVMIEYLKRNCLFSLLQICNRVWLYRFWGLPQKFPNQLIRKIRRQ